MIKLALIEALICIPLLVCSCRPTKPEQGLHRLFSQKPLLKGVVEAVVDLQNIFEKQYGPDADWFAKYVDSVSFPLKKRWSSALGNKSIVDSLNALIYGTWQIAFDTSRADIHSLLPPAVLQRKKGSCMGVSLLFLLLAEQLECPLYGVLLPGHFIVRYDDGATQRNIEPNRAGYAHPDHYYRTTYAIDSLPEYDMRNLSKKECLSALKYCIANICFKKKRYEAAEGYYRGCLAGFDDFTECWGNLAILYAKQGKNSGARAAFKKAYAISPGHENLLKNIGIFELGSHRYTAALEAFREGLTYFPADRELLYGIACSFHSLQMSDSVVWYMRSIEEAGTGPENAIFTNMVSGNE